VERLCGVERTMCKAVLEALVEAKFLVCKPDGTYTRLTEGHVAHPDTVRSRPTKHYVLPESGRRTVMHQRIEAVLSRIRPVLKEDGLGLELVKVFDNGAIILLTGLPAECASAPLNLQMGLEEVLHEEIDRFGELRMLVHVRDAV
jgi:Fe-S cluster biogenesis protein NfuA